MLFYGLALLIWSADQLVKFYIHQNLAFGQSIKVFDDLIRLTYVRNTGAAFSLFVGFSPYLTIVGLLVVAAVIFFYRRYARCDTYLKISLALVLGGSLGNLLDRIVRGYVIDYIDIGVWPVFNIADIMINIGVILIAIRLIEEERHAANSC